MFRWIDGVSRMDHGFLTPLSEWPVAAGIIGVDEKSVRFNSQNLRRIFASGLPVHIATKCLSRFDKRKVEAGALPLLYHPCLHQYDWHRRPMLRADLTPPRANAISLQELPR